MRRDYYENPSQVRKKGVQAETAWTPFDYPRAVTNNAGLFRKLAVQFYGALPT